MNDRLDPLILSAASDRWQKVAKIIALASDGGSDPVNVPAIASRIASLVDEGKLEAKGDVSNWRFSEVRRPKSSL
jgi:hypothetical protein